MSIGWIIFSIIYVLIGLGFMLWEIRLMARDQGYISLADCVVAILSIAVWPGVALNLLPYIRVWNRRG